MLRAVVLAARLEFTIDQPILDAMAVHRHEIARSAPARLLEEYYKILRSGHAEQAMRQLRATKLMKEITPELAVAPDALWRSIARARSLPRPLPVRARLADQRDPCRHAAAAARPGDPAAALLRRRARTARRDWACCRSRGATSSACSTSSRCSRGCSTCNAPARAQRDLLHRSSLDEAITWLEIHGDRPDVVAHWRDRCRRRAVPAPAQEHAGGDHAVVRARRRRRGTPPLARSSRRRSSRRADSAGSVAGWPRTGSRRRARSAGAAASPDPSRCSAAGGR